MLNAPLHFDTPTYTDADASPDMRGVGGVGGAIERVQERG